MLNIISLQALRKKATGPSKVAKNLIKGLEEINYPYTLNDNLNKHKFLYILDDEKAFHNIKKVDEDTIVIAGPILQWKKNIPEDISNKYHFLYPSHRIKKLGDKYKWHKKSLIRPAGIDTASFLPSDKQRSLVLIYFKTRFDRELKVCKDILDSQKIEYTSIDYDKGYKEADFIHLLEITKYVIWIGRQETQGIALQEILSMDIPILVWDVDKVGYQNPKTEYEKRMYTGEEWDEFATSAEYFDENCGVKVLQREEMNDSIEYMEKNYKNFKPREYIIKNLSLAKQAKDLISLFESLDENPKQSRRDLTLSLPWRYNFFIRILWKIIDNNYLHINSIITKAYQIINRIR